MYGILKFAPVLSQKWEKMRLVRTFCSSTAKTSMVTPIFFSMILLSKDSSSFRWEKNWHKSMFSFLAILLNCTDWAITGQIARIQFNSTLECKVKTRALWRENEHGDPHFLLLCYHLLDLLHQCTKFDLQSMLGSFTKESP